MTEPNRPVWGFPEMTERDFRAVWGRHIVAVEAKWEFTSADTSREWLEARTMHGKVFVLPSTWEKAFRFAGRASTPGLFRLTYEGERMQKRAQEIDAWEVENAFERAEFERLRKKFGDQP